MADQFKNPWGEGSAEYQKWQPGHDASNQYLKWLPQGAAFFDESQEEKQEKWNAFWGKNKSTESEAVDREAVDEYSGEEYAGLYPGGDGDAMNPDFYDDDDEDTDKPYVCMLPVSELGQNPDSLPAGSVKIPYELEYIGSIFSKRAVGRCKANPEEDFYVQKAIGTLSLYKKTDTGRELIKSVRAVSGSGVMGCIPNSEYAPGKYAEYYVGNLLAGKASNFHDGENPYNSATGQYTQVPEHSYKIHIYDPFKGVDSLKGRGLFRIHPTPKSTEKGQQIGGNNDGCISPWPGESVEFYHVLAGIFKKSNMIVPLKVEIQGNNNYTVYIAYTTKDGDTRYNTKYVIDQEDYHY